MWDETVVHYKMREDKQKERVALQYIVLDLEWNQPWPGSYAAKRVLPVQIRGEIIQIGAVRMLSDGTVADEFQVLVCPKYYKKLNSRVSKLTGLRDSRLREEGPSLSVIPKISVKHSIKSITER